MKRKYVFVWAMVVLSAVALLPCEPAFATLQQIYWTDAGTGKIQRANLDGSGVTNLISGLAEPRGIAIDDVSGKIYWTDWRTEKIQRANLDGSGVEDVVASHDRTIPAIGRPLYIALDIVGGKMYWTEKTGGFADKIKRANLDGSGMEIITQFGGGGGGANGIALDVHSGKMYYTCTKYGYSIRRANLDGSYAVNLITVGRVPSDIALDLPNDKMYWVEDETAKVRRANLNGSGVEDLITGLGKPFSIALDLENGKLYWTDAGTHKVQRANLDGSGAEDLITFGLVSPWDIAVGPIPEPAMIEADVDIDPDTLNLASKGQWITCYISLPEEYNVADIDPNSVRLEEVIAADWMWFDEEEQIAVAKFNRSDVQDTLEPGEVELTISGELTDGTMFEGTDVITVIDKGGKK